MKNAKISDKFIELMENLYLDDSWDYYDQGHVDKMIAESQEHGGECNTSWFIGEGYYNEDLEPQFIIEQEKEEVTA